MRLPSQISVDKNIYTIKDIESFAFLNCDNIENITINSVENIGESAFNSCSNLCNVEIYKNLKYIDNCAFTDCTSLGYIDYPNSLEKIGEFAFQNCNRLINYCAGENLKEIQNGAFWNCCNLDRATFFADSITLGNSVFFNTPNTEFFVKNEEVKQTFINSGISESQITILN